MLLGLIPLACAPAVALGPIAGPLEGAPIARLAVVGCPLGGEPERWSAISADIAAWDPDAVLWTGGVASPRGKVAWERLHGEIAGLGPALAVPAAVDLQGDRHAHRFATRFASGSRWVVETAHWRLVGMPATGESAVEAGFWVPRVLGPTAEYRRAISIVGGPPRSVIPGLPPSQAPRLAAIAREAAGDRLPLVIGGNTGSNELFLPDGPLGAAHLVAGNAGAPGHSWPDRPVVELQPDFAMGVAVQRHLDDDRESPLTGWWTVELREEALAVSFRQLTRRGLQPAVRGTWSAEAGWDWERLQ